MGNYNRKVNEMFDNSIVLNNGVKIPQLGLGTWFIDDDKVADAVKAAVEIGYRHIDTAQAYGNERGVGEGVRTCGIPREELFVVSKVAAEHKTYEEAMAGINETIEKMGLDYLDMMIIHSPQPWAKVNQCEDRYVEGNRAAWKALEDAYKAGKLKAIGISNFLIEDIASLLETAKIKPMVNQMETHPLNQQKTLKEWADKYDIRLEAWAPFGEGRNGLFENEVLKAIGQKYGKSTAQVMLRWHIQRGVIVIPKSVHKERMIENLNVFDFRLDENDMSQISQLDTSTSAFFSHQDPAAMVEWFVKMVEKRKSQHDSSKEKKNW